MFSRRGVRQARREAFVWGVIWVYVLYNLQARLFDARRACTGDSCKLATTAKPAGYFVLENKHESILFHHVDFQSLPAARASAH